MRTAIIYLSFGLLTMLIILYSLGWHDLVSNEMLTGDILKDLRKSFKDYPEAIYYFRYIILIGSLILALIFYGVKIGIEKLKG